MKIFSFLFQVIGSSHRAATLLVCTIFIFVGSHAHATYRVELDAPDSLKSLLTEHLDLFRYRERADINVDQLNFMIATVAEQVEQLAATEGYFSVETVVKADRAAMVTAVHVKVTAKQRTMISQTHIDVSGAAAEHSPTQVKRVQRSWSLPTDAPFRQQDWDDAKQNGLQILQQRRYPTARIADSEARIDADKHQAALAVQYDSGPLFTVGPTKVIGASRYPESIIHNVNPLLTGEEYSVERLLEFQRQILRTPYFSNVVVDIDREVANAALAPITVQVTEFPRQRIRGGIGVSSDTGAKLEGLYAHNDLFGRAWVLNAQARLEQRRQFGSLELALPPGSGAFINSSHGSFERTTLEGIDLRSRRLGFRRSRTTDLTETSYSLEYYRDSLQLLSGTTPPSDSAAQLGSHQALVVGIDKTWRQVDNLVFPRKGRIMSIQTGLALQGLLTDQSFFRFYGRLREYVPINRRDLLIFNAQVGAVVSKGSNPDIPASLMFRTGGADSVRGYAFQSIGNERNGIVYPTRFMAAGSMEYQHWISREWGGAVFYDIGAAADSWDNKTLFHAVGVGARWRSPVGRINADLAYGFQSKQIRPHISLGITF